MRPPDTGLGPQISTTLWAAMIFTCMLWFVIRPVGDLVTDRGLVGKAVPVPGAKVEGRCSGYLGVLTSCDGTLTVSAPGQPDVERRVDYFFVDFHTGDYTVRVVADPARPELLSTDLGLDKITNRTVTLVVLGPLFLLIGFVGLQVARRTVRQKRATMRALSNQVLRPVLLRMDHYALRHWVVSQPPVTSAITWSVPRRARPIVMDPARKAVLGVTAGDGRIAMPLDAALTWIDLTDDERRDILAQIGPERLAGGLIALDTDEAQLVRRRMRRMARGITIAAVCLAALAGAAAWVAFSERDGSGELVELQRGDEAAKSASVRLRGVWQVDREARVTRVDGNSARLETWVPVTAPGWRAGAPVTWLIRDALHGIGTSGLATRSGTVLPDGVPADVRAELERHGIVLANELHLLDRPVPPDDPLQMPALVVLLISGTLALGLLLGSVIVRAKVRRREAIFRA